MKKYLSLIAALSLVISNIPLNVTAAANSDTAYDARYGDINSDEIIDSFDIISMKKLVGAKVTDNNKCADLNGDLKIDENDLELLNYYCHGKLKAFPVHDNYDTDEDGLSDFIEYQYSESSVKKADTDSDGLTDYFETFILGSDPTISGKEAKADDDGDKLSNIDEQKYNTNPNSSDTDDDGLTDYYEINESNTDPLKADTDGDGIIDSEEIKLKLDPLKKASNGTPDNERIIQQTIPSDSPLLSEINTEGSAYNLSLVINASGCADSCLSVRPSGYAYVMKDGSAIGETPALYYNDDFKVKDITLKFEIKEAFRDNVSHYFDSVDEEDYYEYSYDVPSDIDGIKRLNIFRYFEDVNLVMPIETQYDEENNIVYATISNFESDEDGKSYGIGSYSLVDLEVWSNMMNNGDDTTQSISVSYNSSLSPDFNVVNNSKTNIKKTLKEISESVRDAITKNYESYKPTDSKSENDSNIHYISMFGHRYACIDSAKITWAAAESACEKMGGHLMTVNTPLEFSLLNGSLSAGKNGGFYWLGAYGGSKNWSWVTGESTSYARTIKVSGYDMDNCRDYFSYLDNKLAYVPHLAYVSQGVPNSKNVKGYICEWESEGSIKNSDGNGSVVSLGSKKLTLDGKISALSNTDTDGDGRSDYDEINFNAIKKIGGSSAQTVTWQQSYDYLKKKGYISDKSYNRISDMVTAMGKAQEMYPTKSNPVDIDTDGDGLNDDIDPNPNLKDITITNLSHEEYLKISHDNNQYYGSNQSWLNKIDPNTLIKYNLSSTFACGLVATGDLIAYLNIYDNVNMRDYALKNGFNELINSNDIKDLYSCFGYNEARDTIDSIKYMNYIAKLSSQVEIKEDFDGVIPFGSSTSIKSCLNDIFKYDSNYNYSVNWRNNNSLDTLKNRIKNMINNNIPTIISYENGFIPNTPSLNLYTKNDLIYTPENDTMSHYMVITGIIEYSADASKLSKHSIMIRVSSWGKEYYIDLEEYCNLVNSGHIGNIISNFSSNILEIRREQK